MQRITPAFIGTAAVLAVAFGILLWLGFWQLERLEWKRGIIAEIEKHQSIDPQTVALAGLIEDPANEFVRGTMTGIWVGGSTAKIGPYAHDDILDYWIVTPMVLGNGMTVFVNRGRVEESRSEIVMGTTPTGIAMITGTLRNPQNTGDQERPVGNNWWRHLNTEAMSRHLGLSNVAPMVLYMEGDDPAREVGLMPMPPVAAEIRNTHLQYAVFWFVMAGALLVVGAFAAFRR